MHGMYLGLFPHGNLAFSYNISSRPLEQTGFPDTPIIKCEVSDLTDFDGALEKVA